MVEFQYFKGCPNSVVSLGNLRELVEEGIIPENMVKISEIPDHHAAERFNFQGSPTILINGVDIYTGGKPSTFNYSCRVYEFDGDRTGIISKEFIKEKFKEFSL